MLQLITDNLIYISSALVFCLLIAGVLYIRKNKPTFSNLKLDITDFTSTYAKEGFRNLQNHLQATDSDIYQLEHTAEDGSPVQAADYASALQKRNFKRKRVCDQKFIRISLWLQKHSAQDTIYRPQADILVNDYSSNAPQQMQNEIINISNGGVGLKLHEDYAQRIVPGEFGVLHLSLYSVKHKDYLPYWFGIKIKNNQEMNDTFHRVGLQFVVIGSVNGEDGHLDWNPVSI